jgi:ABC-type transporter Mla subunit MlaD
MSVQSIGIKIWGDLKDLTTALNKGSKDVEGFTKGTDGAFKNLYATVKKGEQNIKDLTVEFGKNSAQVKQATAQLAPFKERLADATNAAKGSQGAFSSLKSEISGMAMA